MRLGRESGGNASGNPMAKTAEAPGGSAALDAYGIHMETLWPFQGGGGAAVVSGKDMESIWVGRRNGLGT